MFFSDDIRIGNTASPTTFEVGNQQDPNVGQYGWTKSDQAHYNQLIDYVNECRDYYTTFTEIAGYVNHAVKELERIEGQTLYIDRISGEVAKDSEKVNEHKIQVNEWYNETRTMFDTILEMTKRVNDQYTAIQAIGVNAQAAADSATNSSGQAIDYYLKTKELYDEWKASQKP